MVTLAGRLMTFHHGGPGIRSILRQLDTSNRAEVDKLVLVKAQPAFWLMAVTDGHAKNFSIFRERGGGFHMTPLYDVLSAWPIMGRRWCCRCRRHWTKSRPCCRQIFRNGCSSRFAPACRRRLKNSSMNWNDTRPEPATPGDLNSQS